MADWRAFAARLEALHAELMAAAPDAPDEIEEQIVELHAISLRHVAHHLHYLADGEERQHIPSPLEGPSTGSRG